MYTTPQTFLTILQQEKGLNQSTILYTQTIQLLVKKHGERALLQKLLPAIVGEDELKDYVGVLQGAGLLTSTKLSQLVRLMKASIGNLAADITTSLERVNVDDIDYEIHQAEIPGVVASIQNSLYKRTLKTDLQKLL